MLLLLTLKMSYVVYPLQGVTTKTKTFHSCKHVALLSVVQYTAFHAVNHTIEWLYCDVFCVLTTPKSFIAINDTCTVLSPVLLLYLSPLPMTKVETTTYSQGS